MEAIRGFMRDLWVSIMNSYLGKALVIWVLWGVLGIAGWIIFQPDISPGSGGIAELIVKNISFLLFTFLPGVVMLGSLLVWKKIQAGVAKQESKDKAEITKLILEIFKIKCERELVESKDRCLESQKEK